MTTYRIIFFNVCRDGTVITGEDIFKVAAQGKASTHNVIDYIHVLALNDACGTEDSHL